MRRTRKSIQCFPLVVVSIALVSIGCSSRDSGGSSAGSDDASAPLPVAASTQSGAVAASNVSLRDSDSYVGSQRCISCHEQRHQSYLKSHHSRSLSEVDVALEVVGRRMDHLPSHRSYEIIERDGQLWHRETLLESQQAKPSIDPLVIAEFPIKYVMGSGKFAKGYLVEDGPFLLQSPVTWYAGGESYGMSPGYDAPSNAGFGRAVTDECLFCHSGMVSLERGNRHLLAIDELAIGCERCHGPGGLHVAHFESVAANPPVGSSQPFHDSIIHPGKLSRLQSESLCGQCHCQGEAEVSASGKHDWDFRPGDDFATVKMNYDAVIGEGANTRFVGHFPQLHASECYQGSSTMTCVTCHDPHHHPEGEDRHELHRQQCLKCHQDEACGVSLGDRMEHAENRCVDCHMPKTRSEVPHTSTTNHRIAVYREARQAENREARQAENPGQKAEGQKAEGQGNEGQGPPFATPQVLALQNPPAGMPSQEVARMRALGTYWLYRKHLGDPKMGALAQMAGQAMQEVVQTGHGDAEVFADLAMLTYLQIQSVPRGPENEALVADMWNWAMGFAQESLRLEPKPSESRETALEIAGRYLYRARQYQQSAGVYGELTQLRRRKEDWATLGISLAQLGEVKGAESALRTSIRINGGDADLYETLAIVLGRSQPNEAAELNATAQRIRRAKGLPTEIP